MTNLKLEEENLRRAKEEHDQIMKIRKLEETRLNIEIELNTQKLRNARLEEEQLRSPHGYAHMNFAGDEECMCDLRNISECRKLAMTLSFREDEQE